MGDETPYTGATIQDVARAAQVSPATVSRVLNRSASAIAISPATVERVRKAAAELRYRPNAAARSLRTTKTQTVGVIARHLLHPFTAELLRVFYGTCQERGYHLLVGHAEHSQAEGRVLGDILHADRVDGVLLLGDCLWGSGRHEDMERLIQTHNHVVAVGARPSVAGELSILVDDARGVDLALEHLVALGHRHIGYLRLRHASTPWEDQQRQAAYRHFLSTHDLPHTPAAEMSIIDQVEEVQAALRSFLALPHRPTAIFVNDDMTAIITLKAARGCGIGVPDDLSIVGFDDIPFSSLCAPGLTTVRQPIEAMGRHAATVLLDRIGGVSTETTAETPGRDTDTMFFPPTLVCRESTSRNVLTTPGDEASQAP